ncbi:MAG: cytosine permease [Deltaproteobacteria bacterium]|nr:cytosine permease [Deltaproteobacteria bacterium]
MDAANAAHSHDDYAQTPVPAQERRSFFSISMVMLGYTFFAASMWTGGALGTGLRLFPDLVVTILAGNLILGVYGGLLGYAASSTNLSTHMLARYAFGSFGSKLPSFMLAFTQIGWFGVGVAMLAYPLNKLLGVPVTPVIFIAGLVMTLTVVAGFKAIEWISWIAVPAILILGFWSMGTAVADYGGAAALAAIEPKNPITFAVGVALGVGSFISGATLTPDFVRFAKNRKDGVSATVIGFTFGNSLMFFFGAIGAMAVGVADTAEVLAAQGLLGGGIALLALNIWTTNDNALYASGLGLANITGWKRKTVTVIAGVVGTIFADFLYNNFVGWLTFLSVSLPPIGGIIIADFFLRCGKRIAENEKPEFLRLAAMIAWAVAIAVSKLSPAEGVLCVAPLNSIITACVVYLIADAVLPGRKA